MFIPIKRQTYHKFDEETNPRSLLQNFHEIDTSHGKIGHSPGTDHGKPRDSEYKLDKYCMREVFVIWLQSLLSVGEL